MGGGLLDTPSVRGYLAESAGQPIACGLGVQDDALIGVPAIAVAPWARSHGVGRAMTARVLADGFAAGAEVAHLHTFGEGLAMYESMGFQLLETWTTFS